MIQDCGDGVGLNSRSNKSATVQSGSGSSLTGLQELLLGISALSTAVGLSEDRGEDGEVRGVGENGSQGNSAGLDGRHVSKVIAIKC